jgi:hypothetical protein
MRGQGRVLSEVDPKPSRPLTGSWIVSNQSLANSN